MGAPILVGRRMASANPPLHHCPGACKTLATHARQHAGHAHAHHTAFSPAVAQPSSGDRYNWRQFSVANRGQNRSPLTHFHPIS